MTTIQQFYQKRSVPFSRSSLDKCQFMTAWEYYRTYRFKETIRSVAQKIGMSESQFYKLKREIID